MDQFELPREEIMREMAAMAMQQATIFFAEMADRFAPSCAGLSGPDTMRAFANAIRETNNKRYPKGPDAS